MGHSIKNMRIHFYGIQGSGSTFPTSQETSALQEMVEYELLKQVFEDLSGQINTDNQLKLSLTDYLGGPINKKTLLKYRQQFKTHLPRIYGGWTTCIHIETADGYDIVLDCGSGFRNCAKDLQTKWEDKNDRHLYILGSHSHFDHNEGFDQAAVCFDPRNTIHIYGNYQFLYSLNSYLGIFSRYVPDDVIGIQTPINFSIMPAKFHGIEIRDTANPGSAGEKSIHWKLEDINKTIKIGKTRIAAFEVDHPAPCLAYKIEHGGKKFVFCTDHELRHIDNIDDSKQKASNRYEAQLIEHAKDADVLYRDGQYLKSEYEGLSGIGSSSPVPRVDWGHSCIEDVQEMALKCRIKQTFIGHHDPNREWSERNWIDEALARGCKDTNEKIELARAGTIIDL
ncbi:MAG: MBL fold metallo-hydrolase [Pseudomonadota bacterium]